MLFEEACGAWTERRLTQEEEALLGVCHRTFRRWAERHEEDGIDGLRDRRLSGASHRAAPVEEVMRMVDHCRTRHEGWSLRHFHSWYRRDGGKRSYSWVKNKLQEAGAVPKAKGHGRIASRWAGSAVAGGSAPGALHEGQGEGPPPCRRDAVGLARPPAAGEACPRGRTASGWRPGRRRVVPCPAERPRPSRRRHEARPRSERCWFKRQPSGCKFALRKAPKPCPRPPRQKRTLLFVANKRVDTLPRKGVGSAMTEGVFSCRSGPYFGPQPVTETGPTTDRANRRGYEQAGLHLHRHTKRSPRPLQDWEDY